MVCLVWLQTPEYMPDNSDLYATWLGGAIVAKVVFAQNQHVTKTDYDEFGPPIIHRKCFWCQPPSVVPSSIVYSHTCNAIAVKNISTHVTTPNNERRLIWCSLHMHPHAMYPTKCISPHHLHHRVQAHKLCTYPPPRAKWFRLPYQS